MSQLLRSVVPPAREPALRPVVQRRLHEMYFPKRLAGVIRRERCRADRQTSCFCVVMLRLAPSRGRFAMLRLGRVAMRVVRATDEVGFYDRHTVCAVLSDTTPSGAVIFINRMSEACHARGLRLEPVLYSYSSDRFGGSDDCDGDSDRRLANPLNPLERMRLTGDVPEVAVIAPGADVLPMETLLSRGPGRVKRAIDCAVAGTALVLTAPLLLGVAAVIKLGDGGPVLFCQYRTGMGGRPFKILKFRTMCVDADGMKAALRQQSEQDGPAFKMTRDPRVTRVGHLLRRTSLDELPQLINVLRGDMSLVGPRPLPIDEQAGCRPWHRARLDVMPGLTCVWQVKGRSRVSFDDWMRMDLAYARRSEVVADLKLLFQTIPAVLLRRGAK